MSIETILDGFFTSKEPGALVLQGKWGVGKTYFWRHKIVPALLGKPWSKHYSYLSLFGINSLQELKLGLAIATEQFDQEHRKERQRARRSVPGRLWRPRDWLGDVLALIPKFGSGLSSLHDKISFYLLRDCVVCFDDIERHSDGLSLKDFLGLVVYLVDQRNCQVVVILNSGRLGQDQAVWDDHREKVFDGELTYAPTQAETVDLGLLSHSGEAWLPSMREGWTKLGVANIRLVRRAATYMRRALESAAVDLQPITVEHMARVIVLLTYSIHGNGEGAPPIEMVMRHDLYVSALLDDKEFTIEEKHWRDTIDAYGVYLHSPLDEQLCKLVQHGYPDKDDFFVAIALFEANSKSHADDQAWQEAWRHYHDTIQENGDEIVQAFEKTWPVVSKREHANNLEALARVLRTLGRADLATEYIDTWVAQHSGSRINELDPRELHRFRKIEDPELVAAIELARAGSTTSLTLQAAWERVRSTHNHDTLALTAFADASPTEIVQLFEANAGEHLTATVKWLLRLPDNPGESSWKLASENVRLACQQIAARSALSADRMKNWFGIEVGATRI